MVENCDELSCFNQSVDDFSDLKKRDRRCDAKPTGGCGIYDISEISDPRDWQFTRRCTVSQDAQCLFAGRAAYIRSARCDRDKTLAVAHYFLVGAQDW